MISLCAKLLTLLMALWLSPATVADDTPPPASEPSADATTPPATQPAGAMRSITINEPPEPQPSAPAPGSADDGLSNAITPVVANGLSDLRSLRQEIRQLITPDGRLREHAGTQVDTQQLGRLAEFAQQIADIAISPSDQLEAHSLALLVYGTLAQHTQTNGDDRQATHRAGQLRSAALSVLRIGSTAADGLGEFWLLQADLLELKRSRLDLHSHQRQAIKRIEQFITRRVEAQHAAEPGDGAPAHSAMLRDVKLTLLQLYDQRGLTEDTWRTVMDLKATLSPDDHATSKYLDTHFGYTSLIGQVFQITMPADDATAWSSKDHQGRVILIHLWADWVPASAQAFHVLSAVHEQYHDRGLSIVSVHAAPRANPSIMLPPVNWPTVSTPAAAAEICRWFLVQSLPRFVLIDRQGRLAAIGGSIAILDQLEPLLDRPATVPEPDLDQPPSTPAGTAVSPTPDPDSDSDSEKTGLKD